MQGKSAGKDKHGGHLDVKEGQIVYKLCLKYGTDVGEVGLQVVNCIDVLFVVMAVQTLLRFSLDLPRNSSALQSYMVCLHSLARVLESRIR